MPPRRPSPWRRLLLGVIALGLLALLVHTVFSEHGYLSLRRQQKEVELLEREIQRLQEENRRLAEEVDKLKNDPRAIERVAREQLQMARPGEKVIALPPPKPPASDSQPGEKKP